MIAVHLKSSYERLEAEHISSAVQRLLPDTQLISESFLLFQKPLSTVRLIYLEIEKTNNSPFSLQELSHLKKHLKGELQKCVEVLSPSIFGNCDIEESMRNLFVLSQQLNSVKDLPEVMIAFEGTSAKNLLFRINVVRLLKKKDKPLLTYFQSLTEPCEYIPERNSVIGDIGKKEKEATIFRLQISKDSFLLRSDSSLNLYRARHYVYTLLTKALGDIRDYNGGIFAKQLELFSQFKALFTEEDPEFLEDFFHRLSPTESQALLPLPPLKALFELFLKAQTVDLSKEGTFFFSTQEEGRFFALRFT